MAKKKSNKVAEPEVKKESAPTPAADAVNREPQETVVETVVKEPAVKAEKPAPKAPKKETVPETTEGAILAKLSEEQQRAWHELEAEILTITGGQDPAGKMWTVKKRGGGTAGVSLKYYRDCRRNEIVTGQPCDYLDPFAPPITKAPAGAMKAALQAPQPVKSKKNCPAC